jgi:hypothetical protein
MLGWAQAGAMTEAALSRVIPVGDVVRYIINITSSMNKEIARKNKINRVAEVVKGFKYDTYLTHDNLTCINIDMGGGCSCNIHLRKHYQFIVVSITCTNIAGNRDHFMAFDYLPGGFPYLHFNGAPDVVAEAVFLLCVALDGGRVKNIIDNMAGPVRAKRALECVVPYFLKYVKKCSSFGKYRCRVATKLANWKRLTKSCG